ncbi:MAG: hypothetical protein AAFV19_17195 [Pseudomonadota bacterium]
MIRGLGPEQISDFGDIFGAIAVSEQVVEPDAMLVRGHDWDEETADELVWGQRHGGVGAESSRVREPSLFVEEPSSPSLALLGQAFQKQQFEPPGEQTH